MSKKIAVYFPITIIAVISIYCIIALIASHILSNPKRIFDSKASSAFTQPPKDIHLLTSDGINIAGWFSPFPGSDQAIILVHGLNSSRTEEFGQRFAEFGSALQKQGFNILMIDLRGHGQSDKARFTFGIKERQDVIASINWLKSQGFQPSKIGVVGVSMGAVAVIGAIVENPDIGALITDSGYAEIYPIIQQHWNSASGLPDIFLPTTMTFASWLAGANLLTSQPVKEIAHISPCPILIIHGIADSYIPVSNADQLKNANPSAEYWETNATEHPGNYANNPQAYLLRVTKFLREHLK